MKVCDIYPEIYEFESLLKEADSNASNSWEMTFIDEIRERFEKCGGETFLSEKKKDKIERIALWEEL